MVFRAVAVFRLVDQFTEPIARLLKLFPFVFLIPAEGETLLQPISVEDLTTCLLLAVENEGMINRVISIGGIESIQYKEIVKLIMQKTGRNRSLISINPHTLRRLTLYIDQIYRRFPVSIFWLDELAVDRITNLDVLPREFGIIPARFKNQLDYLEKV